MSFNLFYKDKDMNTKNGLLVKIKYQDPQTVIVLKNNKEEKKSKAYKDNEEITNFECGESKWNSNDNSLEFYITNEPDCNLYLNTVNAVQLSLRFNTTVESFYSDNGPNSLIYNIAAVMKISPEQIRISNLLKGSVIAIIKILDDIPSPVIPKNNETQPQPQPVNNSTATPIQDMEKFANKLTNRIIDGTLSFSASLLDMKVVVTKAPVVTPPAEKNDTDPKPTPTPTPKPSEPSDEKPDITDEDSEKKTPKIKWFLPVMIVVYLVVIGLIIIVVYWIIKRRRRNAVMNLVEAQNTINSINSDSESHNLNINASSSAKSTKMNKGNMEMRNEKIK